MKNKIAHRRLSRRGDHRQALFKNLVTALVKHERIRTTLEKAKEIKPMADKVITWGKYGTHQYHVKANAFLQESTTVTKLFKELAPRYKERQGGYTRIVRAGFRRGDNAEMAIIEYIHRAGELRPAKPPAPKVEPVPAAAETLQQKGERLAKLQQQVLEAAKSGSLPSNLLPSFPSPSLRPLLSSHMDAIPGWRARRQAWEEGRKKRAQAVPVVQVARQEKQAGEAQMQ